MTDLLSAAKETTIVEFKSGNSDLALIAKYISALSNSAALEGQREAYILWGVDNETKEAPFKTHSRYLLQEALV